MPQSELKWFHVVLGFYGSWLPGDPRGFRTRHHREHVEGDYKSPPPTGIYEERLRRAQSNLKIPPRILSFAQRRIVGECLRDSLIRCGSRVACLAVGGQHVHLLVELPPTETWNWLGIAKRDAWFALRNTGDPRKLWGKHGRCFSITDRSHQENAYRYIVRHEVQGAWVWRYSEGLREA